MKKKYAIIRSRNLYGPERDDSLVEDSGLPPGHILFFESRKAANAWITEENSAPYITMQNESTRPDFHVVVAGSRRFNSVFTWAHNW